MSKIEPPFRPIADAAYFPLLAGQTELPCAHLMGCKHIVFMAPENLADVRPLIGRPGTAWQLYGDTRWPHPTVWIEFCTSPGGYSGRCGVLVMCAEVRDDITEPFGWMVRNNPLQQLFPPERLEETIQKRHEGLLAQAKLSDSSDPTDLKPKFIQTYCIYREEEPTVRMVAAYMDVLNASGVPIPKFRMGNLDYEDVEFCRFAIHSLFCLNRTRLGGMPFFDIPQFQECEPAWLLPDQKCPRWTQFHPSRVLRTRPALRALPSPEKMFDGIMTMDDMNLVMDVRRREYNSHALAYAIDARPRISVGEDEKACMSAYSHRANGGAIYVLPDRLVEEFDNTDCDEIHMADLKLPFPTVFIKFTPPEPLELAECAPVDGCYIAKQGEEYLVVLTSHWEEVDYEHSLSVACIDPTFSIHLPAPKFDLEKPGQNTDICVNESVEKGIQMFLKENVPPTENLSQEIKLSDGTTKYFEDIRAKSRARRIKIFESQEPVFRACLNVIVNAACFISFRPNDIMDDWEGEPPEWVLEAIDNKRDARRVRDRKRDALRNLAMGDYTRIKICGKKLFTELPETVGLPGSGKSPRAHWRRGHWRRQRHGVGLSLITPRWIRPTIVKKDDGPLVETRIYDVESPPGTEKA
jgi:hypothetical protein